ncbi:MAG: hypothetical protein WAV45_13335 [Propionibacteriaceae bacterium]|nr:hypothetical protein [Micropruina sp.]HBX81609.1 hypothetical protein [Propionibacteriaceae bacterium]HBY22405.1 hypothetical protein [Propionibacteriaceae bacterium]
MMWLAVICGCLLAGGVVALAARRRPAPPRLSDALLQLDGGELMADAEPHDPKERLGSWAQRTLRIGVSPELTRRLKLRNLTVSDFVVRKLSFALAGLLTPLVIALAVYLLRGESWPLAVPVALVTALLGFITPDLLLRGEAEAVTADATEALLTFFDLVTLERLANQSAAQSLSNAAAVSDVGIFRWIGAALERARLEQRAPFQELRGLGRELGLPALTDLADVMRLDDAGASLAGTLRARVKELRDAHLTETKVAAASVSERMTFFMVAPSLLFGLIFLVPPLLRLIAG